MLQPRYIAENHRLKVASAHTCTYKRQPQHIREFFAYSVCWHWSSICHLMYALCPRTEEFRTSVSIPGTVAKPPKQNHAGTCLQIKDLSEGRRIFPAGSARGDGASGWSLEKPNRSTRGRRKEPRAAASSRWAREARSQSSASRLNIAARRSRGLELGRQEA